MLHGIGHGFLYIVLGLGIDLCLLRIRKWSQRRIRTYRALFGASFCSLAVGTVLRNAYGTRGNVDLAGTFAIAALLMIISVFCVTAVRDIRRRHHNG